MLESTNILSVFSLNGQKVIITLCENIFSRSAQPFDGYPDPNGYEIHFVLINFNTLFCNECQFQVIFKSGTRVDIACWNCDVLNIRITPSVEDFNLTDGLCQNFNGIKEYNLEGQALTNETSFATCPQRLVMPRDVIDFIQSWR